MLRVGLTGGIGAGKSEVSRLLASYGAVVVDADRIAREVVGPRAPRRDAGGAAVGAELQNPDRPRDPPPPGGVLIAAPENK
ncbi:dephospho-CoA kinase, partial [Streptomyces sp. NPDC088745]|uniref:dephospho-CoA kinase n=1 Tax=Streptomyces sp. NPDC088745 TaxID=3365884 RepID=UPI0038308C13